MMVLYYFLLYGIVGVAEVTFFSLTFEVIEGCNGCDGEFEYDFEKRDESEGKMVFLIIREDHSQCVNDG